MTDNLAVFLCDQGEDDVASVSQFFYELSLGPLTKSARNDMEDGFPIVRAFIADVNHYRLECDEVLKACICRMRGENGNP